MQHVYTIKETALEFRLEALGGLRVDDNRNAGKIDRAGLVELFQAIHDGSTLDGDSSEILGDARIRSEYLRGHWQMESQHVARRPAAVDGQIFSGFGAFHRLAVHHDIRVFRPTWNSQMQGEVSRL